MELEQEIQQEIQQESQEQLVPNLQDLKEGKISVKQISRADRIKLEQEEFKSLTDERQILAWNNGWRNETFFGGKNKDGTPKPFEDHEAFLKRIENEAPVQKERLKNLSRENADKDREIAELKAEMKKIFELNKMSHERAIVSDEEKIKMEMQQAEEESDIQKFKVAQAKLNQIEQNKVRLKSFEEKPKEIAQEQAPEIPYEVQQEIGEWIAVNSWYQSDPRITNFCNEQSGILARSRPDLSLGERLDLVKKQAQQIFPNIVPTPKQVVLPTKSNGMSQSPKPTMTFDQLPENERKTAEWMIKRGIYKSKSEAVKAYFGNQNK